MEGEFNNLNINNTPITFSNTTNNIATSDETTADPIYQRQMGTNYSRAKKVSRVVIITGVTVAFTAIALSTGGALRNVFILKPTEVSNANIVLNESTLSFSFTIKNPLKYVSTYFVDINGVNVLTESCQEEGDYNGEYSPIASGDKVKFYVTFTNSFDYFKTIYTKEFVAK